MSKCNFCGKTFSTVSSLNNHKKTAKYCIDNRDCEDTLITEAYSCDICKKCFNVKSSYERHIIICGSKITKTELQIQLSQKIQENKSIHDEYARIIKEKDDEILKLHKEINKIHNTEISNDIINRNMIKIIENLPLFTLTASKIKELVWKYYTVKHLIAGIPGIIMFIRKSNIFVDEKSGKLMIACTSKSRYNFVYVRENDNLYKDFRGVGIMDMIRSQLIIKIPDFLTYTAGNKIIVNNGTNTTKFRISADEVIKMHLSYDSILKMENNNTFPKMLSEYVNSYRINSDIGTYKNSIEHLIQKEMI